MLSVDWQLMALLRAGLWKRPVDPEVFANGAAVNWEAIYANARKQTVLAVVFDGIGLLPPHLYPPRPLVMRWYADVVRIEQANQHQNKVLAELVSFYLQRGVNPVLLKGQGIASLYPQPEHRQCGDIDFLLGTDYKRSKQLLDEAGIPWSSEGEKHFKYVYRQVMVENHRIATGFYNPIRHRRLMVWMAGWAGEEAAAMVMHEVRVRLPQPGFNVVYLLIHALQHFISEGIGLRHLCDWALAVRAFSGQAQWEAVLRAIHRLSLYDAFVAFAYVSVHYLGLPADCFPVDVAQGRQDGEFLLRDTLQGGNFGYAHRRSPVSGKGWRLQWQHCRDIRLRCSKMEFGWKAEARWYPCLRALNLVKKRLKGLT